MPTGSVVGLARFPVKSMGGEGLSAARVDERGFEGDRWWAVYAEDGRVGSGKTTRRFRRVDGLLQCSAHYPQRADRAAPVITAPDGKVLVAGEPATDAAISAALGRPLTVRPEGDIPHHDDSPVHLITTASLRALEEVLGEQVDRRRFRANLIVDVPGAEFVEDTWKGRTLAVGCEVVLRLGTGMPRCVMVNAAQRGLGYDVDILKALGAHHDVEFGLIVDVVRPSVVHVGDPVTLL